MVKVTKNKIVYEENINNHKGKALAIVFPESDQEIQNLIKISNSDIIPRGAGTSFTGATIPQNSTIIDLSKKNKILELSVDKKTVYVESGILIRELNERLEKFDLEFPIVPFFEGIETIGGMIAKNSSGSREIKYGRVSNWIDYLEAINGQGELIKVSKSDLSDFVGMEGTTGIILRVVLRLTNRKKRSISILKSASLGEIYRTNQKLRLSQDISSIELLNKEISHLLGFENKYHLFVEYENNEGLFKSEEYFKFYKLKNKAYSKIANEGYYLIENSKVFIDSLDDFVIHLEKNKIPYISHFASGVFYSFYKPEEKQKQEETSNFVKKLKGKVSYSFGFGLTKKSFLEKSDLDLMKRVKARQDPNCKFNKYKLIECNFKEERVEERAEQTIEEKQSEQVSINLSKQEEVDKIVVEQEIKEEKKEEPNPEEQTIKKPEQELTPEEKEKIKKIAFGFFGGKKENDHWRKKHKGRNNRDTWKMY